MVRYSHLFKNFPQFVVIHTVSAFGIVNKAEVDVFLELFFFDDPADVGNLISGSSAFSKSSLTIWKFIVHVLFKPALENFLAASEFDRCPNAKLTSLQSFLFQILANNIILYCFVFSPMLSNIFISQLSLFLIFLIESIGRMANVLVIMDFPTY